MEGSQVSDRDDAACRDYVASRLEQLRRVAYLLCGDWHAADDLVSTTLLKLFVSWRRISRVEHLDAYVRGMLTNAWLDEHRRPWRRERTGTPVPDRMVWDAHPSDRPDLGALLDTLGKRQRAVLVLRFYCDLSVQETAQVLGIAEGTVKSQSARALQALKGLAAANGVRP
jgi:RNA polymerase sigma-70 factor (sigma-E family)